MQGKICSKCNEYKNETDYSKSQFNRDYNQCKICIKKYNKVYRKNNSENIKIADKKYRINNKEKYQMYEKIYREKYKKIRNLKEKNRRLNPSYKIRKNCSRSIQQALGRLGSEKGGVSVLKKLPYTIQQLKDHLEKQFDHNMSWENYGSYWHIDHIYPQSKLPYTNMDHFAFQLCWSLDNLRPLEKSANMVKSNKIISS